MSSQSPWDIALRKAKELEVRLENSIARYSSLENRIGSSELMLDEEVGATDEENNLITTIETDLKKLSGEIENMRTIRNASGGKGSHQEVWIKRYHDIQVESNNDYRRIYASLKHKRDTAQLFNSNSKSRHRNDDEDERQSLLSEGKSINNSIRSVNDLINLVFENQSTIRRDGSRLANSGGGLKNIIGTVPSIKMLIDGVKRKKTRETIIVATFIGILLCFTIWWMFLR